MSFLRERPAAVGWITTVDPRVKVVAIFMFVIIISTLHNTRVLLAALLLLLGSSFAVGISGGYLLKRLTLILPFGGLMLCLLPFTTPGEPVFTLYLGVLELTATREGWAAVVLPGLRMITAFMGMFFLAATTTLPEIIHALQHLKVPKIFIVLMDFTVRYLAVVLDELARMQTARKARSFVAGKNLWHWHSVKTIGSTLGLLFLRAYDRSERVYLAMLSRGYDGSLPCCGHCHSIKKRDLCWGAGVITTAGAFKFFDLGVQQWILLLK